MRQIFLIIVTFLLYSCASISKKESPMIYIGNASSEPISSIQCTWANGTRLSLDKINPGESRSMSFYIKSNKEFFGLIKVSWLNNRFERQNHEFFFYEKHLPSIVEKDSYSYVQLYLDQEGLEIVSSDEADLSNKLARMDKEMVKLRQDYLKTHKDNINSLIIVDKPVSNSSWMNIQGN